MAQWDHTPTARLATFFTLDDITRAKAASTAPNTDGSNKNKLPHAQKDSAAIPILNLIKEARNKSYETICLPLTTEKWKERWEGMCLLPVTHEPEPEGNEGRKNQEGSESDGDEYMQDGRDGEAGIRSKSERDGAEVEVKKKKGAEAAEQWRAKPGFLVGEVTITRLEEAEGITAMISDWLELDAEDDGIRHDAEIVSNLFSLSLILSLTRRVTRPSSKSLHMLRILIFRLQSFLRLATDLVSHPMPESSTIASKTHPTYTCPSGCPYTILPSYNHRPNQLLYLSLQHRPKSLDSLREVPHHHHLLWSYHQTCHQLRHRPLQVQGSLRRVR